MDDTQFQQALVPAQATENISQSTTNNPQVTEQVTAADQVPINTAVPLDEGGHWLMAQPVENTTLQLMALSNEQTITEVMQRHQELGQNLRVLKTKTKKGRDRFILIYGSFTSSEQANLESKTCQKNYRKLGRVR